MVLGSWLPACWLRLHLSGMQVIAKTRLLYWLDFLNSWIFTWTYEPWVFSSASTGRGKKSMTCSCYLLPACFGMLRKRLCMSPCVRVLGIVLAYRCTVNKDHKPLYLSMAATPDDVGRFRSTTLFSFAVLPICIPCNLKRLGVLRSPKPPTLNLNPQYRVQCMGFGVEGWLWRGAIRIPLINSPPPSPAWQASVSVPWYRRGSDQHLELA